MPDASSVTLDELAAIARGVPGLEARVKALEEELKTSRKPLLAAWSTLREVCEYSGISYHSLRRPEYVSKRPAGGAKIRGVTRYPKAEVIRWCEEMGK
ncbi:MAG: hypothetical protein HN368_02130 [Spirochaetales bacterium]|jgi:hypothetical protein|nr:hypothetical protein [Spirochaetales bacterium]